jgi:hypothetical protein
MGLVQNTSTTVTGKRTISKAFTSQNTLGNCLIVFAGCWTNQGTANPLGPILTVYDYLGNVFYPVASAGQETVSSSASSGYMWVAPNCKAGSNTVTVVSSALATSCDIDLQIYEWSGLQSSAVIDQASATQIQSSHSVSPPAITTLHPNEVLFAFGYDQSNSGDVFTITPGMTPGLTTSNPDGTSSFTAYLGLAATNTFNVTITMQFNSGLFTGLVASLKMAPPEWAADTGILIHS